MNDKPKDKKGQSLEDELRALDMDSEGGGLPSEREHVEEVHHQAEESAQEQITDVATLQKNLHEAHEKVSENWELYVKARADMENIRRRNEKALQDAHKFAIEGFVKELIAVVDSLERGIEAKGAHNKEEGLELTLTMLLDVLSKHNVAVVNPQGDSFNPDLHEAMTTEAKEGAEPNTVLKVIQKGFTLNSRLLRPALVVVSKK